MFQDFLSEKIFVVAVITTKNRVSSLQKAIDSAVFQTRKPDLLIVVSDSDEQCVDQEHRCVPDGCVFLRERNNHEHNYGGSLNIAIDYVVENIVIGRKIDPHSIVIATLDDDDLWHKDYLEKCMTKMSESIDFVVSGINYHSEKGCQQLTIPAELTMDSFLAGNPHIQGSNTFVRLSTLLMAGCFDECMPSTTDRDLFVRIMQLNPQYATVIEHLVDVYAYKTENRITTNQSLKQLGLRHFYRKYSGLMSDSVKESFHKRNKERFNICQDDIIISFDTKCHNQSESITSNNRYQGLIVIGVIVTYLEGAKRLLNQIDERIDGEYKVVLLNNTGKKFDFPSELCDNIVLIPEINNHQSIAENRQCLQQYIHRHVWKDDNCVCWLLDDDMEMKQLMRDGKEALLDIRTEIQKYRNEYDAVVGGYSNDAPLPLLSTLRVSLLDYVYSSSMSDNPDSRLVEEMDDCYYSLTDAGYKHIEAPVFRKDISLDGIFRGHTYTRRLFNQSVQPMAATNRGGNTLVFNKELLLLPTCSLKIKEITARRGDYVWVQDAIRKGYKISQVPFCTYHNREKKEYDHQKELDKMLRDILGSSFTKAMGHICNDDLNNFDFEQVNADIRYHVTKRLSHFVESYYRVMGLLHIAGDNRYSSCFKSEDIDHFMRKVEEYSDIDAVNSALREVISHLDRPDCRIEPSNLSEILCKYFQCKESDITLLGVGIEGCVFKKEKIVCKVFYDKSIDLKFLESISDSFALCSTLYGIMTDVCNGYRMIMYDYEESFELTGIRADDLCRMLLFGRENGFCFTNIKPSNFIMTHSGLKFIDYGKGVVPFEQELYDRSIERAYQMFRYYFLGDTDFRELISRSYHNRCNEINSGLDVFRSMFTPQYKEEIHDTRVIQTICELKPKKVLDYGAGKCKMANNLVKYGVAVDVFDINVKQLRERAVPGVKIIESANDIKPQSYDLVNCNQVLCWTTDNVANSIMADISKSLKKDGKLVLSICNPFFTDVQKTMLRGSGRENGRYREPFAYQEYTDKMKPIDGLEYHRPVDWYERLLRRYGFDIIDTYETDGIDRDTARRIGEHLVFVCSKRTEYEHLDNLTLMIKTCAMDYACIYENIRHIVGQLEYGVSFKEKILVVDTKRVVDGKIIERNRVYSDDDDDKFGREIERAINNGLIDRIVFPNEANRVSLYKKYFAATAESNHSENGNPLFATLTGFENVTTDFVFQTDCDILYSVTECKMAETFRFFEQSEAVTMALSIPADKASEPEYGRRTEVRCCFLNLSLMEGILPLQNSVRDGVFELPWHRALDRSVCDGKLSVRLHEKGICFIHPDNECKKNPDYLVTVRNSMERGIVPDVQLNGVDLTGNREEWLPVAESEIVVVSRGKNTSLERVKQFLDSIKMQECHTPVSIVYTDANSCNVSDLYAAFRLRYEKTFQGSVFIQNRIEHLEIDMLKRAIGCIKRDVVVILVDNDDYLIGKSAIDLICRYFDSGADFTCGNCIRYDKPLKRYQLTGFGKLWERNGDNVWLHPICFRKSLFQKVNDNDFRRDGELINICTDFAYCVPMIQMAEKPMFIESPIYYFEPSLQNQRKVGSYSPEKVNEMRNFILQKAKERYEKDSEHYRR